MKILTEGKLRSEHLEKEQKEYLIGKDVFVTPMAEEYLKDRGIILIRQDAVQKTMTRIEEKPSGKYRYFDAKTGEGYVEKPEYMTHLRGNLLVPKTSPRIRFRGYLDSLQAEVLCIQEEMVRLGEEKDAKALNEILECLRRVLAAEVKDEPLEGTEIFGLEDNELREISHNVKKYIGVDHMIPDSHMGKFPLALNRLRARIREGELAAAEAFLNPDGTIEREDIIRQMNRLSSAVYILFCRCLKESGYGD